MGADAMRRAAHDIRTPLAVVMQGVDALMTLDASGERAQHLFNIVRRNVVLMGEVLTASVYRSPQSLATATDIDLGELAKDVVDLIRPILETRRQSVTVKISGGRARVSGDYGAFARVVLNLLDNASKYGPVGDDLLIRVARRKTAIVVSVHDHGPGIPPGDRHAIFRAFYRTDAARRSTVSGVGLGLSVVRELIAEHGGTVGVGRGRADTRVWFSIPTNSAKEETA